MSMRTGRLMAGRAWLALLAVMAVGADGAAAQVADTVVASREPLFVPNDAWYAAGFVVGTVALSPIDLTLAEELRDSTRQANRFLRDAATGFRVMGRPGALLLASGMYAVGRVSGHDDLADVGLHTAESILLATWTTDALKSLIGRARPDEDPEDPHDFSVGRGFRNHRFTSFPSGHTTSAFAAAAAFSSEIERVHPGRSWWVAPLLYSGATLVGASRVYNNKHWASDVVAGAAIGTFAGWKVTRFNHNNPGNRLDRWLLRARPAPNLQGGVTLSWTF
jgi:membrane-associated phospholipid phosphatase